MSESSQKTITDQQHHLRAEFDLLADEYHDLHRQNISITGEGPEYFSEYKIEDLAKQSLDRGIEVNRVLDFGCGIGNSVPYFRKYFARAALLCADVSERSIEIAKSRFPGKEEYALIGKNLPMDTDTQDMVFSACVFHHIPHSEHEHWLEELWRVTCPGGMLAIYEHNPLNPLTVRAVNTCPLDVNAHLIRSANLRRKIMAAGWKNARVDYKLFFPASFRYLRPLEPHLRWLALGAQYCVTAQKIV